MTLEATVRALRRFGQAMVPSLPEVDRALAAVRLLLDETGLPYRLVGGIAVIHHGYERFTRDVDVLMPAGSEVALDPLLPAHGFVRESRRRLRHVDSGTSIDLLIAGDPMPRPAELPYPDPTDVGASPRDTSVIDLEGLVMLKLRAGRSQDRADVGALLKRLSEGEYIVLEANLDRSLRPELFRLWEEAQQELAWERAAE